MKYIKYFEIPGEFTLRLWARANSFPSYTSVAGLGQYVTGIIIRTDTVYVNNTVIANSGLSTYMSLDTWTHIALTRDSGNRVTLWIGKTPVASMIIGGTLDRDHM